MAFDLWKFLGISRGSVSGSDLVARSTASHVYVTTEIALQTGAFLRAARVVAEGMGSMPLKLFNEWDEKGRTVREVARKHKSYKAICYQPCWLSKSELVETLTLHAFVTGNGYAFLNRGQGGGMADPILEILPLMPGDVSLEIGADYEPIYNVNFAGYSGKHKAGEILHIRGPSWDGKIGMSTLAYAREAIGLARALEQTQARLMGTDARPAGVLTTNNSVGDDAAKAIRERWRAAYGPDGTKGVAVLDNGFKFESIATNAVDAQLIENRRFQIEEIARITGVFPQMLMHTDKTATFASSSEFFAAHVKYTMLPWVNRWEEAIKRDAVGWEGKNGDVWPRFTMDVLLRATPAERQAFYTGMINVGVLSPNDVRALENLNPREGGDEYLTPMNMRQGAGDQADPAKDPPQDPPQADPPPKDPPEDPPQ